MNQSLTPNMSWGGFEWRSLRALCKRILHVGMQSHLSSARGRLPWLSCYLAETLFMQSIMSKAVS